MNMPLVPASGSSYTGLLEDIPPTASPGLLFLKAWIPALDSLEDAGHRNLNFLVSPSALIYNNSKPPNLLATDPEIAIKGRPESKEAKRARALKSLSRVLRGTWDIQKEGKLETRLVFFESINQYIFNGDAGDPVMMAEAVTLELEKVSEEDQTWQHGGVGGWRAIEVRSWYSPEPIITRRAQLGC
jgi:hypothetical protein